MAPYHCPIDNTITAERCKYFEHFQRNDGIIYFQLIVSCDVVAKRLISVEYYFFFVNSDSVHLF